MSYAIIGFGKIGQALAKAFARNGIEVSVATTRDPESFAADAAAIGPTIIPKTLAEAIKADIVFLAVRFESHPDIAKALPSWAGKTVIDAMNLFPAPEGLEAPSSAVVAKAFTGAKLVKGFNHLIAATLATDPVVEGGRRVVPVERRRKRDRARGGLGQTTRVRPHRVGKAQRGRRAGACARPRLGSADLPGSVQEGAIIDPRPCDRRRKRPSGGRSSPLPGL
jgi:hypothetical protein